MLLFILISQLLLCSCRHDTKYTPDLEHDDIARINKSGHNNTEATQNINPDISSDPIQKKHGPRICIIGAGPSGITAYARLRDRAIDQITIFEKENRIGGQCYTTENGCDMGAIFYSPKFKNRAHEISESLKIKTKKLAEVLYYDKRREKPLTNGLDDMQNFKSTYQAVDYLFNRYTKWIDLKKPYLEEIPQELHQSWSSLVQEKNWDDFRLRTDLMTTGFGYVPEAPALYNTYYMRGEMLLGKHSMESGTFRMWEGGTQQIWEKLAQEYDMRVRLNTQIERITRKNNKIYIKIASEQQDREFDKLIIACNPKNLLPVLDASKEEKDLYNKIKTVKYETFEVQIDDFLEEKYDSIVYCENLYTNTKNKPLAAIRQNKRNIYVFYVNADEKGNNSTIREAIIEAIKEINKDAQIKILSQKNWDYFPHVDSEALGEHFYKKMHQRQGINNTYIVGSALTFNTMFHSIEHTEYIISQIKTI